MSDLLLPEDENGNAIQILALREGDQFAHNISGDQAQVKEVIFEADTKVISIESDVKISIQFGTEGMESATSQSHVISAGRYEFLPLRKGQDRVSIYFFENGEVNISERV